MSNSTINKQTKDLYRHMNDFVNATLLKKKGEAAIFDSHRQSNGEYSPGLKDDLASYRKNFANEWGQNGWRNKQFVKNQFDASRQPTEEEMSGMQESERQTQRENFLNDLRDNTQQQKNRQGPKMR